MKSSQLSPETMQQDNKRLPPTYVCECERERERETEWERDGHSMQERERSIKRYNVLQVLEAWRNIK